MIEFLVTVFVSLVAICLCLAFLWLFCLGIGSLCDLVASPWIKRKPTPPVDPKYDPYWATGGKKPK